MTCIMIMITMTLARLGPGGGAWLGPLVGGGWAGTLPPDPPRHRRHRADHRACARPRAGVTSHVLTLSTYLTRSLQNLLLTSLGGVLYIISGSATLTFYIPLVSTDQYPRHTGLALGGLTIMAGVALIRRSLHLILIIYFPTSQSTTWWGCGPGAGTRWRTPSTSAPASPSTATAGARRGQQSGGTFITTTPPVYTTWGRPSHTASNQTNNNNS